MKFLERHTLILKLTEENIISIAQYLLKILISYFKEKPPGPDDFNGAFHKTCKEILHKLS